MTTYKIIQQNRNSYFYGKYLYSIWLFLPGAIYLKSLNHEQINKLIEFRNNHHWAIGKLHQIQIDNLHHCCGHLTDIKTDFKITTHYDGIYFYTSNLSDIDQLLTLDFFSNQYHIVRQSMVVYDKNFVYLKNPKFLYRSYLSNQRINYNGYQTLTNFIQENKDYIKVNARLDWLLNYETDVTQHKYIHSSDFIDHTTDSEILMINLIIPNLVRKTFKIKAK
jgi:hypothetical protein